MRLSQDLCIALVLAVVGAGLGRPVMARSDADDPAAVMERAMSQGGLSRVETDRVRALIAQARECERSGDEDGAVAAMAEISVLLNIA